MPSYIIHRDGAFNLFTTITDGPVFDRGVTREELETWYRNEYGQQGMRELPARIARALETSCSSLLGDTLQLLIATWARVHHKKADDFIPTFLTLPKEES